MPLASASRPTAVAFLAVASESVPMAIELRAVASESPMAIDPMPVALELVP